MGDNPTPTLPEGSLVADRYRVLGHLGTGGMGTVYRVEHLLMGKHLALKLLRPELSSQPTLGERFEREARSAARLDHPRIVRVTDFGRTPDGGLFMVMELVEGMPLSAHLARGGRESVERSLALLDQILEALDHAHGHDVVHRDIKPANIMLSARDGAKLVDFGIAKITAHEGPDAGLTQLGAVIGTPRYMSPEQAGGELVDARTDLYAVGVLAFELLSGRAPYEGASSVEVLSKHLTAAVPPLVIPGVEGARAAAIEAVVRRAMAKQREHRFQTAAEFRAALASVRAEAPPLTGALTGGGSTALGGATAISGSTAVGGSTALGGSTAQPFAERLHHGFGALRRGWYHARTTTPRRLQLAAIAVIATLALLAAALALRGGDTSVATTLVENGEAALGRGDLPAARAIALQALAKDPTNPRAHLLEFTLALAEDQPDAAVTALREAVHLDPAIAADPVVERAVRAQIGRDGKSASGLVGVIATDGGPPSIPLLVELARTAPKPALRKEAYAGLERLAATRDLDALTWLTEELRTAKVGCTGRKWYVDRLIALRDPRTLPTLKKELNRRGGFLNLSSESECMGAELRAGIKALEVP